MKNIHSSQLTIALDNYKVDSKGCYIYQGYTDNKGYPRITVGNKPVTGFILTRVLLARKLNKNYEDLDNVCHSCDNPSCINSTHLFEGTQQDNIKDASKKGRLWRQQFIECPWGHSYNEENTKIIIDQKGRSHRKCKICIKYHNDKRYNKNLTR